MARFYLDNDVGIRLARLLDERGHDATFALNEQTMRLRDCEHLLYAATTSRILVTHNRKDYLELHHAWLTWTRAWDVEHRHSGVIVLPQNAGWDFYRMADEVETIVLPRASMTNRLVHWTPARGWIEG